MYQRREQRSVGGHILEVNGKNGVLRRTSDTPPLGVTRDEVGLELYDGALLLKSNSLNVPKEKWYLTTFGEYNACLGSKL